MKSMEKLDILRTAGIEPKQAEAIVRTQEAGDYLAKEGVATREDLQRVKVEMIQWMAGLAITIILFVVGFGLTVLSRLPALPSAT